MSFLSPRLRKLAVHPSSPAPICSKLLRSKSTSTIDTEILHSVRKVDKRVRNIGKRINKLPMLKSSHYGKSSQMSMRIDQLLLQNDFEGLRSEYQHFRQSSDAAAKEKQRQCYILKQQLAFAEKSIRQKDAVIERLGAQLQCQKALKDAYQFEATRHTASYHRLEDKRNTQADSLRRQLSILKQEKQQRDSELNELRRDFRVLKGEFSKLNELIREE